MTPTKKEKIYLDYLNAEHNIEHARTELKLAALEYFYARGNDSYYLAELEACALKYTRAIDNFTEAYRKYLLNQ